MTRQDPPRVRHLLQSLPDGCKPCHYELVYVATLNFDFISPYDPNGSNRLLNALAQAGWEYSGKSATMLVDGSIGEVLLALEVLARGIPEVKGELGALSLQIQLAGHPRPAPAARFHNQALNNILGRPLPSESL